MKSRVSLSCCRGRNMTALFGAGLIDAISEETLRDLPQQIPQHPEVTGRAGGAPKDGHVGRFGWKAQQASLADFALAACAVELGLSVPGRSQARLPHKSVPADVGLDMTSEQCDSLVQFCARVCPGRRNTPIRRTIRSCDPEPGTLRPWAARRVMFARWEMLTDCTATCDCTTWGPVWPTRGADGLSASNSSDESEEPLVPLAGAVTGPVHQPSEARSAKTVALCRNGERRLCGGARYSGPYLHDGRAETLEEAIALHGGEGQKIVLRFFALNDEQRQEMMAFLKSLVGSRPVDARATSQVGRHAGVSPLASAAWALRSMP